jgi:hypothetical protein
LCAIARFKLAHRPFDMMLDGFRRDFQIRRGFGSALTIGNQPQDRQLALAQFDGGFKSFGLAHQQVDPSDGESRDREQHGASVRRKPIEKFRRPKGQGPPRPESPLFSSWNRLTGTAATVAKCERSACNEIKHGAIRRKRTSQLWLWLRRRKPRLSPLAWSRNHGTTRRRRRAARPAGHRRGRTATERSSPDAHPLAVATLSPVVGDPVQCRPRHRDRSHRWYWLDLFTGSWLVRIRLTAGRAADRRNPENTGAVAGAALVLSQGRQ